MDSLIFPLLPDYKDYIWGGAKLKTVWGKASPYADTAESWEVSTHPDGPSVIGAGPLTGKALSEALTPDMIGPEARGLPVLIKLIDAAQNLSVQVHPGDAYARAHEGGAGKTEMWYIADAENGSGIYCGFKRKVDLDEARGAIENNTLESLLNFIQVKRGESYFIPAGTVHAIGEGLTICEIQQNSNLTYRLYDYGRTGADGKPRPLHIEKGLDVASLDVYSPVLSETVQTGAVGIRRLAACPYFTAYEYVCADGCVLNVDAKSYAALNFMEGAGQIGEYPHKKGSSFFIPAGAGRVKVTGGCVFLLTRTV
jgi:mannose-6-phosphate isomerase